MYTKATKLISCELFDELMKSDLLDSNKIYYPNGDKNFIAWGLLLYLLSRSNEGFNEKMLWQINSEWSSRDISFDDYSKNIERDLKLLYHFINGETLSIDEYTILLQKGYIKKVNGRFELAIIWLKDEEIKQQLIGLCNKIRSKYKEELESLKERYCQAIIENKPKQVQKIKLFKQNTPLRHCSGVFLKRGGFAFKSTLGFIL